MNDLYFDASATDAERSQMCAFARHAERVAGVSMPDYSALHHWACSNHEAFWQTFLDWSAVAWRGNAATACVGTEVETARFFPDVRLNYARNLLKPLTGVPDSSPALAFRSESSDRREIERGVLRREVLGIAAAMRERGVQPGDRVVALACNSIEAIEACIGAAAIGATWSSVAPDLGTAAVLDRFRQLEPVVLFAHCDQVNHGVARSLAERVVALVEALPSLRHLVMLEGEPPAALPPGVTVSRLAEWTVTGPLALEELPDLPFDHPLFILFSSGTTGAPKCIVHGAGGTLLEHLKELRLHTDLRPSDRLYFHTSCGWMMWNWTVSAIATGARLVVFDGSPSFPDATALLRMIDEEGVTVFGTSPAYIELLRGSGVEPKSVGRFENLRAIESTGSILYDAQFDWIRDHFKHVPIHSISGGTDIIGCFVLGNPWLPVYRGESQCVSLGMDVRVITDSGVERSGIGELVCVNPFPSRPVAIWNDPERQRFHASYFAQNPGVWTHGDRVHLTERGSARILGRSDGTLKIRGVRIGPAELYSIVLGVPGIAEAMAVEQADPREPGGNRIVLLVVMVPGITLDRALTLLIKKELSQKASAVHVPAVIAQVSGLPQTLNGKYSERAACEVVNGRMPANRMALKNPEVLDELAVHPALQPPGF